MAEWLYEQGIGENRAILVEDGEIVEAAIELPSQARAGAVLPARLVRILVPAVRGVAALAHGEDALLEPVPPGLTEGAAFNAEIVREAISEAGRTKLAKVRATTAQPRAGPALAHRLAACTRHPLHGADRFEEAGWSELLEQAATGEIPFSGGALRMSLTPAMTLFDVDGNPHAEALAEAGASAAAKAIRRFGIAGSIGIDLPTLSGRGDRQDAARAIDALLPQPFDRPAVNGFGFLQILSRRERASIPELIHADPPAAAARSLLRRTERSSGHGPIVLTAAPTVIDQLERRPEWIVELRERMGAAVDLHAQTGLAIWAGHVHRQPS